MMTIHVSLTICVFLIDMSRTNDTGSSSFDCETSSSNILGEIGSKDYQINTNIDTGEPSSDSQKDDCDCK